MRIRRSTIQKVAHRYMQATTQALPPSFPPTEIGLMTQDEFLKYRNSGGKHHDSGAYDFNFTKMNTDYRITYAGKYKETRGEKYVIYKTPHGYIIKKDGDNVVIVHKGTAYHTPQTPKNKIPKIYFNLQNKPEDMGVTNTKMVKYLHEYMHLVSDMAKLYRKKYSNLVQRIKSKGDFYEIRSKNPLQKNKGDTIAIFNGDGYKVASAQDEWGATLIVVAQEYRGRGLGQLVGKLWYQWNPDYKSGGFTQSGQANALKLWESRVREFLALGWYTQLIRDGRLTKDQLKKILSGLPGRKPTVKEVAPISKKTPPTSPSEVLFYVDVDMFVIYDQTFFTDPDDKYIYAHGFLRNDSSVGSYVYSLDYDRSFHKMATYAILQLARDLKEPLFDGKGTHYSDLLELQGLNYIKREGDYIELTKNVLPMKLLGQKEKLIRKKLDSYNEKYTLLLEMANSKWN